MPRWAAVGARGRWVSRRAGPRGQSRGAGDAAAAHVKKALICFFSERVASKARASEPVGPRKASWGAQLATYIVHMTTCMHERTQTSEAMLKV